MDGKKTDDEKTISGQHLNQYRNAASRNTETRFVVM